MAEHLNRIREGTLLRQVIVAPKQNSTDATINSLAEALQKHIPKIAELERPDDEGDWDDEPVSPPPPVAKPSEKPSMEKSAASNTQATEEAKPCQEVPMEKPPESKTQTTEEPKQSAESPELARLLRDGLNARRLNSGENSDEEEDWDD